MYPIYTDKIQHHHPEVHSNFIFAEHQYPSVKPTWLEYMPYMFCQNMSLLKKITSKHQIQASSYDFSVISLGDSSTGIHRDQRLPRRSWNGAFPLLPSAGTPRDPKDRWHRHTWNLANDKRRDSAGSPGKREQRTGFLGVSGWWFEPTHLKNISQNGFIFPQKEAKIKQFWNHHPVLGLGVSESFCFLFVLQTFSLFLIGMVRLMVVFGGWTIMEDGYNWIDG